MIPTPNFYRVEVFEVFKVIGFL